MKKYLLLFVALALVLGISKSALAFSYYEAFNDDVWLDANNTSHTWAFDLDTDSLYAGTFFGIPFGSADINPEDTINSAFLTIGFKDDEGDVVLFGGEKEYADLTLDNNSWMSHMEIDGIWWDQIIAGDITGYLTDHILSVTVARTSGDFGVDFVSLFGCYTDNPSQANPVPEPTTMLLLGTGLIGLMTAGRKRRKS